MAHAGPIKPPIYLDAHATTPCDPRVVEAMLPTFSEHFGNPASRQHAFGWRAEALVEQARERVAALLGAAPEEIIFTSGATESNNLAILGAAHAYAARGRHIVTSALEHRSVLDPCRRLEHEGWSVTYLPVAPGSEGVIRKEVVAAALTPETTLVSIMAANNELGTLNPIDEIARLCQERRIIFHTDAVQALALIPINVEAAGIGLLSISAHKIYGPKGIGALYVRRRGPRVRLEPLMEGGGHEHGLRPGTLNVPGIVGLGKAAELALAEREADAARIGALRDDLLARLRAAIPDLIVNGSLRHRLPNNINVSFPGIDGASLLSGLTDIAVSSGAACASAIAEPSHVLQALGLGETLSAATLRISLHRFTVKEEVARAAEQIIELVLLLRREASGEPKTSDLMQEKSDPAANFPGGDFESLRTPIDLNAGS